MLNVKIFAFFDENALRLYVLYIIITCQILYELDIIHYLNLNNLPCSKLHLGIYKDDLSLNLSLPIMYKIKWKRKKKRKGITSKSMFCIWVWIEPTNQMKPNPTLQVDFCGLVGGVVLEFYFKSQFGLGLDLGLIVFSTILLNLTHHIYVYFISLIVIFFFHLFGILEIILDEFETNNII